MWVRSQAAAAASTVQQSAVSQARQPISMLLPQVMGFKLTGKMPEGATATDLVLTVTQILRKRGVRPSTDGRTD